ncbi:MAG: hypothetical protein DLM61_14925 [Pseudonocardiales bacterium]|nr:MAG: hypothetical protein DLM61_14925 [Pseudonocardiales bacterium]
MAGGAGGWSTRSAGRSMSGPWRVIARRVPRPAGKQTKLGEDPDWEYGGGRHQHPQRTAAVPRRPAPHPSPRRRPEAVQGLRRPQPALDRLQPQRRLAPARRSATSLTAWLRHLALDGELAKASTKTLRFRVLSAPARLVTHARRRILKIPPGLAMVARPGHSLAATANLASILTPHPTHPDHPAAPDRPWKPAPPRAPRAPHHTRHRTPTTQ